MRQGCGVQSTIDKIRRLGVYPYAIHLTRIENLRGMCAGGGIMARNCLKQDFLDISEKSVQSKRATKTVLNTGSSLHDYVPFFLSFKAPMVASRQSQSEDLVYLQINLDIFERISGCVLTDGNATNQVTRFDLFDRAEALKILDLSVLYKVSYAGDKEKARKKASELLVPKFVPLSEIHTLIFYSEAGKARGLEILGNSGIVKSVKVWPKYFFGPEVRSKNGPL